MQFKDLTGKTIRERQKTSLDNRLNTILNAFGEYANMQAAKDEKLVLNVVDSLARKSGGFNSGDQFDLAFQSLNEAREMTSGGVAKSLLDNYETTLMKEQNTFVADDAIKTAFTNTKTRLGLLTSENHTEEIASILEVLNGISQEYRNDASNATLKMLDSLNEDVRHAVGFANLLDDVDKTPAVGDSPNVWDEIGLGAGYSQVKSLMLAGDYKQARTKANSIQLKDSDAILDLVGSSYKENVDILRARQKEYLKTGYHTDYAGSKVLNDIPKSSISTQKMYPQKLDQLLKDTGNLFTRYFNDPEILWDTDEGKDLQNAFNGQGRFNSTGGWHTFVEELDRKIIKAKEGVNRSSQIDRTMYAKYLNDHVDFMPDQAFKFGDPGFGPFGGDADNKLAIEFFLDYMDQYNLLLSGKERLSDITTSQSLGF